MVNDAQRMPRVSLDVRCHAASLVIETFLASKNPVPEHALRNIQEILDEAGSALCAGESQEGGHAE